MTLVTHEVGGSEGVLHHHPAGREDHKIGDGGARLRRRARQHSVDGWILKRQSKTKCEQSKMRHCNSGNNRAHYQLRTGWS
jgi:hypothetical protein